MPKCTRCAGRLFEDKLDPGQYSCLNCGSVRYPLAVLESAAETKQQMADKARHLRDGQVGRYRGNHVASHAQMRLD